MVADLMAVVGLILLSVGLALWSIPLALVVVGLLLLAGGIWSHLHKSADAPELPRLPQENQES